MADCNLNSESTGCISYNGCEFKDEGFSGQFCQACYAYKFNNSTENSTSCKSCETDYDFDTMNTGKQWDSTDDSRGNTECPWICTDNWYKSGIFAFIVQLVQPVPLALPRQRNVNANKTNA